MLDVCQKKGCWITMENHGGKKKMVKFKDYDFFMPKNIVGKQVALDGEASVEENFAKQLKHYTGDAGKSNTKLQRSRIQKKS